jgi:hypothetical protein
MAQLERVAEAAASFVVALVDSPAGRDLSNLEPNAKAALSALWKELDQAGCLEAWRREHWGRYGLAGDTGIAGRSADSSGASGT